MCAVLSRPRRIDDPTLLRSVRGDWEPDGLFGSDTGHVSQKAQPFVVAHSETFIIKYLRETYFEERRIKTVSHDISISFSFLAIRVTENSVRSENPDFPIIREIMVAITMSSFFVALFALVASSFFRGHAVTPRSN